MTLLLALLAIAAYFSLPEAWRIRVSAPLPEWLALTERLSLGAGLKLLIAVTVPMLIVAVAIELLSELASLLAFLAYVAVVAMIFGDNHAQRTAQQHQLQWSSREWPSDDDMLADALSLARQHRLRDQFNELFAPLFWLLLATPVAALGYYVLRHIALHESPANAVTTHPADTEATTADDTASFAEEALAITCLRYADWLPSRLLALSFALAGNFTATWAVIRDRLWRAETDAYALIDSASDAAEPISIDPSLTPAVGLATALHQLDSLLQRALVVWMVFLAVKTLWPGM